MLHSTRYDTLHSIRHFMKGPDQEYTFSGQSSSICCGKLFILPMISAKQDGKGNNIYHTTQKKGPNKTDLFFIQMLNVALSCQITRRINHFIRHWTGFDWFATKKKLNTSVLTWTQKHQPKILVSILTANFIFTYKTPFLPSCHRWKED